MISAEDAARFLHHACRGLPDRVNGKAPAPREPQDAFFAATIEHALACFGSRILYPARPAFRDADLRTLYDLTREDLEQQTSLPYSPTQWKSSISWPGIVTRGASKSCGSAGLDARPHLHRTQVGIRHPTTRIPARKRSLRRLHRGPHRHRCVAQTLSRTPGRARRRAT